MTINTQEMTGEAVKLAKEWQEKANDLLTKDEKAIQNQMSKLLTNPMDKVILTQMIDQSFRSGNTGRVADQIHYILTNMGVPRFFSFGEKLLTGLFLNFGRFIPWFSIPRMISEIRNESSRAIIPGEEEVFLEHLKKRELENVRMNINHLGEAVLGEEEALTHLDTYLKDLKKPEVEYISVKISTIYSQILPLAFEETVSVLKDRLTLLFRTARDNFFIKTGNVRAEKFVNLDMEEYRDLEITAEAFIRTLDMEEFKNHSAGIVLQAYLPDSFDMQKKLTDWAKKRVEAGGAPIKIRIVKGANMEMEQVESAIHNWPLAPYDNKLDVDANYKRMVCYGMQTENIKAVNLGIASHNLFELAWSYRLAEKNNVTNLFTFELLEGMADHVRRALAKTSGEVLLYAPVATKDQFINAIGYLIRRLDENTAPENFLRYSANLKTESKEWEFLKDRFIESVLHMEKAGTKPHRNQDRNNETFPEKMGTFYDGEFSNEPDTDWSLASNRKWAEAIREKWMKNPGDEPIKIPVVIAGEEIFEQRRGKDCIDPSRFNENIVVASYSLGNEADVEKAVETAKNDPDGWRDKSVADRNEILSKAAMELRKNRGDLIGSAAATTGKVFTEADVEVSEAIDFAEYYPYTATQISEVKGVSAGGKGVGLVISPWNFPIAIPCGGMISALAAGNTVIFKPASNAVVPAWELCKSIWAAGVSKNTLQFIPCSGANEGAKLANHKDVDFIILTGGTDTGLTILKDRPGVYLAAETGGKNATIVTSMADRDLAIKNILHSAFSNCGQKCSATSLLILEDELYYDEKFKKQLVDAANSINTGSAWDFNNKLATLIGKPSGDLLRGLTKLDDGEEWVLKPKNIEDNPMMWTPGIKWGVKAGSYSHMTEFFGPVLSVMRAKNLETAIRIVNQTGYGLTSGIESLDKRETDYWKENVEAGNLYINRGTTGAIVLRQPFGGMKKSALGAGIKAGGPNYVSQFMNIEQTGLPQVGAINEETKLLRDIQELKIKSFWGQIPEFKDEIDKTIRAVKSYLFNMEQEFGLEKDYFKLRGQDNIVRYRPVGKVLVRVHEDDTLFETLARIAGVKIAGCSLKLSIPKGLDNAVSKFLLSEDGKKFVLEQEIVYQSENDLIKEVGKVDRIRFAAENRVPEELFEKAAETGFFIARSNVLMEGRFEMLNYFYEQSICDDYHRYGNLGDRSFV